MIYDNPLWMRDIEAAARGLDVERVEGKAVLIPGASGLIGSAVVDMLIHHNARSGGKITIYAAGRSPERLRERFAPWANEDWLRFVPYDALDARPALPEHVDYVIHGAGNAAPAQIMRQPVQTMIANVDGVRNLLAWAAQAGAARLLYISSSEVYGRRTQTGPAAEDCFGTIDPLNPRNVYPLAKKAAEVLCAAEAARGQVETVIVRPGHIYGPTASSADGRVSSAFPWAAARGEDLVLKSDGAQIRSYCYCPDCASGILTALCRGANGAAYNISNPDSVISIRDMARYVAAAGGVALRFEAASETERRGFNPMDDSSLNSARLMERGWRGCFDAETGLRHTVEILRQTL